MIKKFTITIIFLLGATFVPLTGFAKRLPVAAATYAVMDADTERMIYEDGSAIQRSPASLTKLASALVLLESKGWKSRVVKMRPEYEVGGARIIAKANNTFKCTDLLAATLIASANNAANSLAACANMSKAAFVSKMNQKAKSLGAVSTKFTELSGIDDYNMSTAADYLRIAKAAFANPTLLNYMQTRTYTFYSVNNKKLVQTVKNTNAALNDTNWHVMAAKTGYLTDSRYNLVTFSEINGKRYITATFGSPTRLLQFDDNKFVTLKASKLN